MGHQHTLESARREALRSPGPGAAGLQRALSRRGREASLRDSGRRFGSGLVGCHLKGDPRLRQTRRADSAEVPQRSTPWARWFPRPIRGPSSFLAPDLGTTGPVARARSLRSSRGDEGLRGSRRDGAEIARHPANWPPVALTPGPATRSTRSNTWPRGKESAGPASSN